MIDRPGVRRKRYQRLLESDGHDRLAGIPNLFDVAMVFAVALLIALFARVPADAFLQQSAAAARSAPGDKRQDAIPAAGDRLERFHVGDRQAGGRGERLGVAYRLPSGEVVYVPESVETKP